MSDMDRKIYSLNEVCEIIERERADEREKTIREIEQGMYHQCFEVDNSEDMQKWDSGNWFRYKLFENAIDKLKGGTNNET